MMRVFGLVCCWVLMALSLQAQVQLRHPVARQVVQRSIANTGSFFVAGRYDGPADRIEARLTPVQAGQGTATGWITLQSNPAPGQAWPGLFTGTLAGTGGWYQLAVRAILNNAVVGEGTVQPVGIGKVFVTAGQSNSRGLGVGDNDLGAITDRVSTIDAINHSYPPGSPVLVSSGDPLPYPTYSPMTAGKRIYPMGESTWGWGELGDYLVRRFNVPVAYYSVGWDASTVENWINSANGIPTCNRYYCVADWPNLQPYTNLRNVLQYYCSVVGIRAVLWHQGESEFGDTGSGSVPFYRDRLTALINKARQDYGKPMPWVVARVSFNGATNNPDVLSAQQQVIDTPNFGVYQGPFNDTLVNRNAGETDVHFRNAQRPVPHPQYSLNPSRIPADMGLSRFARNWNLSLSDPFFSNATPQQPDRYLATADVPNTARGDSLRVSFATLGSFAPGTTYQLQLLDTLGRYRAVLGSGTTNPLRVKLPDTLTTGRYRVRVVALPPLVPGVPSAAFTVRRPGSDDLSVTMEADRRLADDPETVTYRVTVRNAGPDTSAFFGLSDRLPANLTFVSGAGWTHQNGVLTASGGALPPGQSTTLSFQARPTASGSYRNAVQLSHAAWPDPDSQPGSGTADGQDDTAMADFRTRQAGTGSYVSPNPNQTPLPAVQSNQPAPDPQRVDLSLAMVASRSVVALNDTLTLVLAVENQGGQTATGITIRYTVPTGLTVTDNGSFSPSGMTLQAMVPLLMPGQRALLTVRVRATASGLLTNRAEVSQCTQTDADSTPGNGLTNGEDDTARVDIRVW